jgi:hypothetical protein
MDPGGATRQQLGALQGREGDPELGDRRRFAGT